MTKNGFINNFINNNENLHLDLLINSAKKKQIIKDDNKYPDKLRKFFNKYENNILQNKIILSNISEFENYLDEILKSAIYNFTKKIYNKTD